MPDGDGVAAARTDDERRFLARLLRDRPALMVWPRSDPDGAPWLCVSRDFVVGQRIGRTLRLDFDGRSLRGGWSPAFLNWDNGVRATDAGIDTDPPDGMMAEVNNPEDAAELAGRWFDDLVARWRG